MQGEGTHTEIGDLETWRFGDLRFGELEIWRFEDLRI
jgi:hypothetical protein